MINLIEIRKQLHKIPELGFKEFKTHEFINSIISKYSNLKIHTFDFPGMLVEYKKNNDDFILFRADMDALPIKEETDCTFESEIDGMMHACGHDIHMTILIGFIDHIANTQPETNLLFLFQPAEEGQGGGRKIIESGILDKYSISEVYALHVSGNLPVGIVSTCPDIIFGIPQEFDIIFTGESSHVAYPQNGKDALAAGVMLLNTIQNVLKQKFSPTEPVIFHVGKMEAGNVRNAVADKCVLQGTTRSLSKKNWEELNTLIKNVAENIATIFNLKVDVIIKETYDPVINSKKLFDKFIKTIPKEINFTLAEPALTGEDFGFFTTKYEGLLFWLGAGNNGFDLHSPKFLPDDKCINIGIEIFKKLISL